MISTNITSSWALSFSQKRALKSKGRPLCVLFFFLAAAPNAWAKSMFLEILDPPPTEEMQAQDPTLPHSLNLDGLIIESNVYEVSTDLKEGKTVDYVTIKGLFLLKDWTLASSEQYPLVVRDANNSSHPGAKAFTLKVPVGKSDTTFSLIAIDIEGETKSYGFRLVFESLKNFFVKRGELIHTYGYSSTTTPAGSLTDYTFLGTLNRLSLGLAFFRAPRPTSKTFEYSLSTDLGYMIPYSGMNFPIFWSITGQFTYRNVTSFNATRSQVLSPFVSFQYESLSMPSSFVVTSPTADPAVAYEARVMNLFWGTLGTRFRFGEKHWVELTGQVSRSLIGTATLSTRGGNYSNNGWKGLLRGTVAVLKWCLVGTELSILSLSGDTQVSGYTVSGLVAFQF